MRILISGICGHVGGTIANALPKAGGIIDDDPNPRVAKSAETLSPAVFCEHHISVHHSPGYWVPAE